MKGMDQLTDDEAREFAKQSHRAFDREITPAELRQWMKDNGIIQDKLVFDALADHLGQAPDELGRNVVI